MKPEELFVGSQVRFIDDTECSIIVTMKIVGDDTCFAQIDDSDALDELDPAELTGIELTGDILTKNGWFYKNGIWVKKGAPRLGWYPKDKTLIIGYHTFPIVVEYVHTLQAMQRILGAEEIKL